MANDAVLVLLEELVAKLLYRGLFSFSDTLTLKQTLRSQCRGALHTSYALGYRPVGWGGGGGGGGWGCLLLFTRTTLFTILFT